MNTKKLTTIILTGTIAMQLNVSSVNAKQKSFELSEDSIIYEEEANTNTNKNKSKVQSFKEFLAEKAIKKTSQNQIVYIDSAHSIAKLTDILYRQDVSHKIFKDGNFINATRLDIAQHLMVEPRMGTNKFKYQFMRIDSYHEIKSSSLDNFLKNKGVFNGHANDFVNAAKKYNIDPIYLVSHAMLESGNGTSTLARGTEIEGKIYYNFFGINAFDADPTYGGLSLAQKEDWSSVSKAIDGGAKWIAENYLHSEKHNQKTIYNMRFNPHSKNPWHLYATDVRWADTISSIMNELSNLYMDDSSLSYEPVNYI